MVSVFNKAYHIFDADILVFVAPIVSIRLPDMTVIVGGFYLKFIDVLFHNFEVFFNAYLGVSLDIANPESCLLNSSLNIANMLSLL